MSSYFRFGNLSCSRGTYKSLSGSGSGSGFNTKFCSNSGVRFTLCVHRTMIIHCSSGKINRYRSDSGACTDICYICKRVFKIKSESDIGDVFYIKNVIGTCCEKFRSLI